MKWERAEKMFAHSGLSLTEGQFHQFSTYQEILVETNRRMNLTTITEDAEVWRKHFLDSCLPFQYVEIPKGAAVIDVGTGAGFPGIPMRIAADDAGQPAKAGAFSGIRLPGVANSSALCACKGRIWRKTAGFTGTI